MCILVGASTRPQGALHRFCAMSGGPSNVSESEGSSSVSSEDEHELEEQLRTMKKKANNFQREFIEVDRWDRTDHSDPEILVFIRKHLDDLNRLAGILQAVPGAHKNLTNIYGDFQFRRKWQSRNGHIMSFLVSCPLRDRCNCRCQAKIVEYAQQTILYFADAHTAEDHVPAKDEGKFLKFQQKSMIAHAVKVAPLQTASELIRSVQDSPTKTIDPLLKKSVARLVRKARSEIISVQLDGVTVDNTIGSLAQLSERIWFGDAIERHKSGECLDIFKIYIIRRQIMDRDRTVFLTFSNVWNILNFWRAVATGYDVQLHGDVTSKASAAALNKLGFGVNMLGAHFAPLSYALLPAGCESSKAYTEAYR